MNRDMTDILRDATDVVREYLASVLPEEGDHWWKERVLDKLSFSQKEHVIRQGVTGLEGLDVAALLRLMRENWYFITQKRELPYDTRHFLHEAQSVRNRWAHSAGQEGPPEDVYRDFDTLQRFLTCLGAEPSIIERCAAAKHGVLAVESAPAKPIDSSGPGDSLWEPGQEIVLASDRSQRGVITRVLKGNPCRFEVFINNEKKPFYASQIQAVEDVPLAPDLVSLGEFHAYLSALQLRHPGLNTLYSLHAARIDFEPYQYRPVLAFIRSDRPRLLIADGVGVGKTIEAGLILRELQARRDIRTVLVICPKSLVVEHKWRDEMRRFDEDFVEMDGPTLRHCLNEYHRTETWPSHYSKAIIPYSLFDKELVNGPDHGQRGGIRRGLLQLDPPPHFDLVIVDEAHHIRNTETYSHRAVRFFCDNAEAALFLTATPIQLGDEDLYVLLHTLRPDLIIDPQSYAHVTEPNPHINEAIRCIRTQPEEWRERAFESLQRAGATSWGRMFFPNHPTYQGLLEGIQVQEMSVEERVTTIRSLEQLHTLSSLINRTRRRDVEAFTHRRPEACAVEFTPDQREVHDEVLAILSDIVRHRHGDMSVRFLTTTIRRRLASCLFGLIPFLEELLRRNLQGLYESSDEALDVPAGAFSDLDRRIADIVHRVEGLSRQDPKLDTLRRIANEKRTMQNHRLMVFSSFRHTLAYLNEHLLEDGYRVGLVHGDIADNDRGEIRRRFELERGEPEALDILLFSEVGTEGLDYQFCDCLVNYDLPWNPMRIEQRIGRLDRRGQRSPVLPIYNLITPGTVDADIYERCLLRIGIFESAVGDSEAILGEITRQIQEIAGDFTLTVAEQQARLDQLASNQVRRLQEQRDLEEHQYELFGIRATTRQMEAEVDAASSYWLSPECLKSLVQLYLWARCGDGQDYILGEGPQKTLRLSQEARNCLLADYQSLPSLTGPVAAAWRAWLLGGDQHLAITFDPQCATDDRRVTFLTPIHPLLRQAAQWADRGTPIRVSATVATGEIPPGDYPFVIYRWEFHGFHDDLSLRPIAASSEVAERLVALIKRAQPAQLADEAFPSMEVYHRLDEIHFSQWSVARDQHQEQTRRIADYRRESLTVSHRARTALLAEQLEQATDERIRVMRRSQLDSANADLARRTQELDLAVSRADLHAQAVAYGMLQVTREANHAL